jgi:type VI secretion system secreted protein VgrG
MLGMMRDFDQSQRLLHIDTPLSGTQVLLTDLRLDEFVNQIDELSLTVLVRDLKLDPATLLNELISVWIQPQQQPPFYYHAIVTAVHPGQQRGYAWREYHLQARPWIYNLTLKQDCRQYQHKMALEVVQDILLAKHHPDFDFRRLMNVRVDHSSGPARFTPLRFNHLLGPQPLWLQFNESEWQFISRLLAECGISYYIRCDDYHTMLYFTDWNHCFDQYPDELIFDQSSSPEQMRLFSWQLAHVHQLNQWQGGDYDEHHPGVALQSPASRGTPHRFRHHGRDLLQKTFPHRANNPSLLNDKMQVTLNARQCQGHRVHATSNIIGLHAAMTCRRGADYYTIDRMTHWASDHSHDTDGKLIQSYRNAFSAVPFDDHITSPAIARPEFPGLDSAAVTSRQAKASDKHTLSPAIASHQALYGTTLNEPPPIEIHTNELGSIKTRFHWDRYAYGDTNSSTWVRVGQQWAGKYRGMLFIPRLGQEVQVKYLYGDLTRPAALGSLPNSQNRPAFSAVTQSGIKTRSTPGNVNSDGHQLCFEDAKKNPQLYLHSARDYRKQTIRHDGIAIRQNDQLNLTSGNQFINTQAKHTLHAAQKSACSRVTVTWK